MPKLSASWFMFLVMSVISSARLTDSTAAKFCEPSTRRTFELRIGVSRIEAVRWSVSD